MRRLRVHILAIAFLAVALCDSAKALEPAGCDSLRRFTRSESKAFRYSLLSTLIPAPSGILTIPGLIIGPSTGYFYGGCPKRGLSGVALRSLIGAGALIWNSESDDTQSIAITYAGLTLASAAYDIVKVRGVIRERNRRIMKQVSTPGNPPSREVLFAPKSEATALRYSAYGTALPICLGLASWRATGMEENLGIAAAGGVILGPSLGYIYAGSPGRGLMGIGLRSTALFFGGIGALGSTSDEGAATAWWVAGGIAAASCIYDIARVQAQVRKNNRNNPSGASLVILPVYEPRRNMAGIAFGFAWE